MTDRVERKAELRTARLLRETEEGLGRLLSQAEIRVLRRSAPWAYAQLGDALDDLWAVIRPSWWPRRG